jgi:PKD repeat protein
MLPQLKYALLLPLLAFSTLLNAQIKITAADMPKVGDMVFYSTTTVAKFDTAATGANYTWNFSNLKPVANDTFKYQKPSGVYAILFSGDVAEATKTMGQQGYSFYKNALTGWSQAGMGFKMPGLNQDLPMPYSNPDKIYQFPLTDSSVYADSFGTNISFQGFNIVVSGHRSTMVDGYGKITTPFGTFDCLRLKSVVHEVDTFLIGINNSRTEYSWLAKGEKIPILQITIPAGIGQASATYRDSARAIINPNAPKPLFSVKDTVVYTQDTVSFTNETKAGNAALYNWTIAPNSVSYVNKTSANSMNPQVVFTQPGVYSVSLTATSFSGIGTLSKKNYITVLHNTGISKAAAQEVSVYPNPSNSGIFTISTSTESLKSISVYDLQGRSISVPVSNASNKSVLDLSGKPAGIYLLKIQTNAGVYTLRIENTL